MIERQLLDQIDLVIERDRRLRFRRALAAGWFIIALLGAGVFLVTGDQPWRFALAVPPVWALMPPLPVCEEPPLPPVAGSPPGELLQ